MGDLQISLRFAITSRSCNGTNIPQYSDSVCFGYEQRQRTGVNLFRNRKPYLCVLILNIQSKTQSPVCFMFVPMFNVFDNKTRHHSKIVGSPHKNSAESCKSSDILQFLDHSHDLFAIEHNSVHFMGGKGIKGVQMPHDDIVISRFECEAEHHFVLIRLHE